MEEAKLNAWLVRKSGMLAGKRHLIQVGLTRVGRSSENDIVLTDAAIVSAHHLEISRQGDAYHVRDLNSTNGTFLNGERVAEAALVAPCSLRLGADGPEFSFVIDDSPLDKLDQTLSGQTMVAPVSDKDAAETPSSRQHEDLLSEAIERARAARRAGIGDSTVVIMRQMLDKALHRTSRKFKVVIGALILALAAVSGYGYWKINGLKAGKNKYDAQIQRLEGLIARSSSNPAEADQLIDQLGQYEDQAQAVERNVLYRVGSFEREDPVQKEIRSLMAEFGAETYSIPPEFLAEVKRFIQQYQGPDRPNMLRALGKASRDMDLMRQIFRQNNLPPDLAYIPLVESALTGSSTSPAGAAGFWQFTPATARQYGLKINDNVDERLDATKSTRAACKYIRDLILDFGAGSSVMLALAAYNLGPAKVKAAVRKVSDPIKQRNFWYLYRIRAVPPETREYVPKVIAVMIIARHPERYGF
ncbi:MAG TPA: transglycosylase SLT domain-containing protein [Bryobacteraceae bacterium]|nr:transglycosylase SLT domain-containing protein [Bryobacteraceae bacterium]